MLDRHIGINPVLIQQVDDVVDLQPPQRCLSDLANVLGPAVSRSAFRLGIYSRAIAEQIQIPQAHHPTHEQN